MRGMRTIFRKSKIESKCVCMNWWGKRNMIQKIKRKKETLQKELALLLLLMAELHAAE